MSERWRTVIGFEGLYEVSSQGRVRSLPKRVAHWQGGTRLRAGRVMRTSKDRDGYGRLTLCKGDAHSSHRVCRLVLEAFKGAAPSHQHETAHDDGSRDNNTPGNLFWKTRKENAADRTRHGNTMRGSYAARATQTPNSVRRIRRLYAQGNRQVDIAKLAGISQSNVSSIVRRETWGHV